MPNLAEHPAEAVLIPIGGRDYKFRITLGSLEKYQMEQDVPSTQEEAEEMLAEAKEKGGRQGVITALLDTLWMARQPYKHEDETREALANAIGPEDTQAVMAGFLRLQNQQITQEEAEEIAGAANDAAKKKMMESES